MVALAWSSGETDTLIGGSPRGLSSWPRATNVQKKFVASQPALDLEFSQEPAVAMLPLAARRTPVGND